MKQGIWTIMRKEFARFFGDKRLVFTTVLMPGLLIYVIYSFLGEGLMERFSTDDTYVASVYVQNMPEELKPLFESLPADYTETTDIEGAMEGVKNKTLDALLCFPQNFMALVNAYDAGSGEPAPEVKIYYNSGETESSKIYSILVAALDEFESSLANKLDVNAGGESFDLVDSKDITGQLFSMLLPMLLMTFLFSGCIAVAPESIAGEKERGTIATLLVTPMKRSALALGKIISLSAIALLSGISSFLGTMLSLPKMMGGEIEGVDASVYGLVDYAFLLGVILTTVLVLISVIAVISAFAKSIKEASTAVSPFMMLIMIISLLPMFTDISGSKTGMFVIPLYNSVLCMHGIFSFQYTGAQMAITMVCNLLWAGGLTLLLTRLFSSEKVMFTK